MHADLLDLKRWISEKLDNWEEIKNASKNQRAMDLAEGQIRAYHSVLYFLDKPLNKKQD